MSWQFPPPIGLLIIGTTLTAVLAYLGWRRRPLPAALPFTILMLAITEWSAGYALQLASADMSSILFWARVQYLGIVIVPAAWLVFALQYSGLDRWLSPRNLLFLAIHPITILLLIWTDDTHHLVWSTRGLVYVNDWFLVTSFGPWFWVNIVYIYALIFMGTVLIAQTVVRSTRPYRTQGIILLFGALAPLFASILFVTHLNPYPHLDITSFSFTFTGITWFWGLFRLRLLEIMPVAQATIVQHMSDGAIVLDAHRHILYINPIAENIFAVSASEAIGQPIESVFAAGGSLIEHLSQSKAQTTITIGSGPTVRYIDCLITKLYAQNGRITGTLLTLHDITKNKQTEDSLRQSERYFKLLNDITQTAVNTLDLHTMLQTLADRLGELINADACHITLWDETNRQTIPAAASGPFRDTYASIQTEPDELTMTMTVLDIGHALAIDKTMDSPYVSKRLLAHFPDTSAVLALPLIAAGQKLGAAHLIFNDIHIFTDEEVTHGEQAAQQIALAIAKTKLNAATKRQLEELTVLNKIAVIGTEATDIDELIDRTTQIIGDTFYPENFGMMLLDEAAGVLHTHHSYQHRSEDKPVATLPISQGITGKVARTGRPCRVANVLNDPSYHTAILKTRSELCVPLKVDDRIIGVINTESSQINAFSPDDERLLTTLAGQLATAIKKIQLLEAEQLRRQEAETLREATATLTSMLDLGQLLDVILTQLETVVAYDSATIFLFEGDYGRIVAARGLPDNESALGQLLRIKDDQLTHNVQQNKQPICLHDAQAHPSFQGWLNTSYIRGWMAIPLIVRGETIGQMTLDSRQVGSYEPADAELALAFANQAAAALENARLYSTEQQSRKTAEILRAANETLTKNLDPTTVLDTLLDFLRQLIPYDSASVMLLQKNNRITVAAAHGYERWADIETIKQVTFDLETNWSFRTLFQSQKGMLLANTYDYPEWERHPDTTYIQSWLGVPLVIGQDVLGFFSVDKAEADFFTSEHLHLAETLAGQTAVAIRNAQLYQEAQRNAEDQKIVSKILRTLNATPDVIHAFPSIAIILKRMTGCARSSLFLLDKSQKWGILAALDRPRSTLGQGTRVDLAHTSVTEDGLAGRLHLTPDLAAEIDFPAEKMLYDAGIRSRMNIPLLAGDQVKGALNLTWATTNGYNLDQLPLLTQIAEGIALAVERSRLFDESNRRAAELEALVQVSAALRMAQTVDEILPVILEIAIGVVNGEEGDVFLVDAASGDLVSRGSYPPDENLIGRRHLVGQGITGHVAATGELYVAEDLKNDPLIHILAEESNRIRDIHSSISLPLHAQERVVGVMNIGLREKRPFTPNEIRLLTAISEIAGSALDRAILLETLEQRVQERTHDLAKANERLQELDRLKTKFVSDVSHELRTPITNLNLYLDLLEKGVPEKRDRYLSVLRKQTARLNDLIEDTMSLSRLDMGKERIKFEPVNLNAIVEQVTTAHLPRVDMAGLTLVTDLQADLPSLSGERNQLAQVVTNLLANAINYTPQGQITIQTYTLPDGKQLCLEVADTGLGIEPEDKLHLFDRFYRGHSTGQSNIPGTGLGLAIVKEIVDLHEGTIDVQNNEEGGATFQIFLPIVH